MLDWLSANWLWLVVIGGMLWMHLGGHGGHGGGHGAHDEPPDPGRASHYHDGSSATGGVGSRASTSHRQVDAETSSGPRTRLGSRSKGKRSSGPPTS